MKNTVLKYVFITLLGCLLALNYTLFIVPNGFAPAGINGIAVMIQYKLNFSVGFMSLIINIPLCILAYFFINKRFAIGTLVFCLVYSLVYLLFQNIDIERFKYNAEGVDTIYPVLIAGVISGFCYSCLFRLHASTGGTDIISKYVSKKRPEMNFFFVTFILNGIVAISSFFVYAKRIDGEMVYNFKPVCLCIVYCLTSSLVGNFLLKETKTAYQVTIITDTPKEIEEEIINVLHHSATRLSGEGIFTHTNKTVLMCVVNKYQIVEFKKMIEKYPNTFAYVTTANETIGNFKKVRQAVNKGQA